MSLVCARVFAAMISARPWISVRVDGTIALSRHVDDGRCPPD
jgi:hypothetical protein